VIGWDTVVRIGELVRRVTGNEEIVPPGMILELERPDWAVHKQETLWAFEQFVNAAVANTSQVQFGIPSGSNLIITIKGISNGQAVGSLVVRRSPFQTAGWLVGNNVVARDSRVAASTTNLLVNGVQVKSDTPGVTGTIASNVPVNGVVYEDWVITPGNSLFVHGPVVNQAIDVTMWGYYRTARPEELTV
jgi:hypothetical protein